MKKSKEIEPFLILNEVDNRLDIHPELGIIFRFLQKVEEEVKELMGYREKLESIKKQCTEILGVLLVMKLDENHKFTLPEHPKTLAEKFKFIRPVRSEFIVIFAHLETLRCLYTAYQKKTSDKDELRDASDKAMDEFIKEFCLSKENQWVKENPKRAGKISAENLRKLRNSLTHFFSVEKLGIVPLYDDETQKMSNKTNHKVQFLSPDDLSAILHFAARLMLRKWSNDCKRSLSGEVNDFIGKIRCVKEVVEKNGAKFIYDADVAHILKK